MAWCTTSPPHPHLVRGLVVAAPTSPYQGHGGGHARAFLQELPHQEPHALLRLHSSLAGSTAAAPISGGSGTAGRASGGHKRLWRRGAGLHLSAAWHPPPPPPPPRRLAEGRRQNCSGRRAAGSSPLCLPPGADWRCCAFLGRTRYHAAPRWHTPAARGTGLDGRTSLSALLRCAAHRREASRRMNITLHILQKTAALLPTTPPHDPTRLYTLLDRHSLSGFSLGHRQLGKALPLNSLWWACAFPHCTARGAPHRLAGALRRWADHAPAWDMGFPPSQDTRGGQNTLAAARVAKLQAGFWKALRACDSSYKTSPQNSRCGRPALARQPRAAHLPMAYLACLPPTSLRLPHPALLPHVPSFLPCAHWPRSREDGAPQTV